VDEVRCVFVDGPVGFVSVLGVFFVWILLVLLGIFDNGCCACYVVFDGLDGQLTCESGWDWLWFIVVVCVSCCYALSFYDDGVDCVVLSEVAYGKYLFNSFS